MGRTVGCWALQLISQTPRKIHVVKVDKSIHGTIYRSGMQLVCHTWKKGPIKLLDASDAAAIFKGVVLDMVAAIPWVRPLIATQLYLCSKTIKSWIFCRYSRNLHIPIAPKRFLSNWCFYFLKTLYCNLIMLTEASPASYLNRYGTIWKVMPDNRNCRFFPTFFQIIWTFSFRNHGKLSVLVL